jgi:hypothetical protein
VQWMHHLRDGEGHAMVVRQAKSHHDRTVYLGGGSIKIRSPRVHDRRPDGHSVSPILPLCMRRSPRPTEALPLRYLRGLSTGDFSDVGEVLPGAEAAGFSAMTIIRLLQV